LFPGPVGEMIREFIGILLQCWLGCYSLFSFLSSSDDIEVALHIIDDDDDDDDEIEKVVEEDDEMEKKVVLEEEFVLK
jgi:nitrogen regulatory protein PII-like uncharacterized protein